MRQTPTAARIARVIIAGCLPALAATVTVSKTGTYPTIAQGIAAAAAGDTVVVDAGVYNEIVTVNKGIILQAATTATVAGAGGNAIIDGTGLPTNGNGGNSGLVMISSGSSKVSGFEIRNYATTVSTHVPAGVRIFGGISNVTLAGNIIHAITTSEASSSYNAHGICCYGNSNTSNSNIVLTGNQVYGCKLGQSESVVLNGNIDGFTVTNNSIHDNDNIGLDVIGYEGTCPTVSLDRARNGLVAGNLIYNISDNANKAYPKNDNGADGIYVDGGDSIIIERNIVDHCDLGIECASEQSGKNTSNITVRTNFISHSGASGSGNPNLSVGGYSSKVISNPKIGAGGGGGGSLNIYIIGNTTYAGDGGEINFQYRAKNITVSDNIFISANSGNEYFTTASGTSAKTDSGVSPAHNLYYGGSSTAGTYPSGEFNDATGLFTNPLVVVETAPGTSFIAAPFAALNLQAGSPFLKGGVILGNDWSGQPMSGTLDVHGNPRLTGSAIDFGADQY